MTKGIRIETCAGPALADHLPALARLRIGVFRDWPYLYAGSEDYERGYLATYINAPGAAVVIAFDGAAAVGAATCLPMAQADAAARAPFTAAGRDIARLFYFGESVLLPAYRGQGIGVAFFTGREAQARAQRAVETCFCTVIRPPDHPARPAGYVPLDRFWRNRGYAELPGMTCQMRWSDIGAAGESGKTMQFWAKRLA